MPARIVQLFILMVCFAFSAWGQTVARFPMLARSPGGINAGTYESPAVLVAAHPSGRKGEFYLTANVQQWLGDPDLRVSVVVERSFDGGATWLHWTGAAVVGGQLGGKNADALPSFGAGLEANVAFLVRVKLSVNKKFDLGLDAEVNLL